MITATKAKKIVLLFTALIYLNAKAQMWNSVGTGMNSNVVSLAVYNGELYADGNFSSAGGNAANCIAKWNGTTWSTVGAAITYCSSGPLAVYNGALYTPIGSGSLQKWNGSNWVAVINGNGAQIVSLCVYNGELYAGCASAQMGYKLITKYNGTGWSYPGSSIGVGYPINYWVAALVVYNGELYAGGHFNIAGGSPANYIIKWNGTAWSAVGTGMNDNVSALAVYNGELYAGGKFTTAGGIPAKNIAKWNGTTWSAVGTGIDSTVDALCVYNMELYAGGSFSSVGGNPAKNIAKWNGVSWLAVGTGIDSTVDVLCVYNGALYAGGLFTTAGGNQTKYFAKLDSTSLGVEKIADKNQIKIYPNPANTFIDIETNLKNVELKIVDVLGNQVISTTQKQIDISNLPNGVYFVQLKTAQGFASKKMLVQR